MRAIGEAGYWTFRRWAAHADGRFDLALEAAKRSVALRPDQHWMRSRLVPDLAALGRGPELLAFAMAVPLATILGTEPLLSDAMPLSGRLPGYIVATALGLLAARGGWRELAHERSVRANAPAADQLEAAPAIDADSLPSRQRSGTRVP